MPKSGRCWRGVKHRDEEDAFARLSRALQDEVAALGQEPSVQQVFSAAEDRADEAEDARPGALPTELCGMLREELGRGHAMACSMLDLQQRQDASVQFIVSEMLKTRDEREHGTRDELAGLVVPFALLQFGERLGSGRFGDVYQAQWHAQQVAVKVVKGEATREQRSSVRLELRRMASLHHPNIAQVMGACVEPANICIMALYERGSSDVLHAGAADLSWPQRHRDDGNTAPHNAR